jgi:hypothetical protein
LGQMSYWESFQTGVVPCLPLCWWEIDT